MRGNQFSKIWRGIHIPEERESFFSPDKVNVSTLVVEVLGKHSEYFPGQPGHQADVSSFSVEVLGYYSQRLPTSQVLVSGFLTEVMGKIKRQAEDWVAVHSFLTEVLGKKSIYTVPLEAVKVSNYQIEVLGKFSPDAPAPSPGNYAGARISRIATQRVPLGRAEVYPPKNQRAFVLEWVGNHKFASTFGDVYYLVFRVTEYHYYGEIYYSNEWLVPFWNFYGSSEVGRQPEWEAYLEPIDVIVTTVKFRRRIVQSSTGTNAEETVIFEGIVHLLDPSVKTRRERSGMWAYQMVGYYDKLFYYGLPGNPNYGSRRDIRFPLTTRKVLFIVPKIDEFIGEITFTIAR